MEDFPLAASGFGVSGEAFKLIQTVKAYSLLDMPFDQLLFVQGCGDKHFQ
jgi:hypothetical protein